MQRRSQGSHNLLQLTNQELARTERTYNRTKKKKSKQATMGDNLDNQAMADAQAQILNMKQQLDQLILQ